MHACIYIFKLTAPKAHFHLQTRKNTNKQKPNKTKNNPNIIRYGTRWGRALKMSTLRSVGCFKIKFL